MIVLVRKSSVKLVFEWTQRLLLTTAILLLGYYGYVVLDTWMFQRRAAQSLERLPLASSSPSPAAAVAAGPDGLIGRLDVQRLGVSVVVIEGTDVLTLRRAAGHIKGTALPGQTGNIGIAGHRDTLFRPLRNIQPDDIITLTTPRGQYRYRVVSTKVVNPRDVAVLNPDGHEVLTLVTCYPFYFVGAAPDRFIIRAARVL
jgi:sortase A